MNSSPGIMWNIVNRGCRSKPSSSAEASGKFGGESAGAERCSALRITVATPISTNKKVIAQRIRTIAGLGLTETRVRRCARLDGYMELNNIVNAGFREFVPSNRAV